MSESPRLTRQDAEKQLRQIGYVRMEGHTATDMEQLDRLYDGIFPKIDAGTYSSTPDLGTAMKEAKALAASEADEPRVADLKAENEELRKQLEAKKAPKTEKA